MLPTLTRQSAHTFNDWPFLFVQAHEALSQLSKVEAIVEQLLLHSSGTPSGLTNEFLAVKERSAWRGERCSRLVAETAATKAMGTKRKARIMERNETGEGLEGAGAGKRGWGLAAPNATPYMGNSIHR
jgi:hypothetical protein